MAFSDAFHGRTMMAIALNGSDRFIEGYGPMPGGIKHHQFNEVKKLEKTINKNTAAVVIELYKERLELLKLKRAFIQKIKKLCKQHKALLLSMKSNQELAEQGHFLLMSNLASNQTLCVALKESEEAFP